jgi:Peptidase family M28
VALTPAAAGCDSSGSGSTDEPAPPPRAIASAGLAGHLRVLDLIARQNGGDRAAGTQGYAGSVAYVAGILRRLGWRVREQRVPMTIWRQRSPASLSVAGTALTPVRDFRVPGYSASGTVDGALHSVDDGCQSGDFATLNPGEVAFTGFGACFLYRKALNAKRAGASALIAQTSPSPRGVPFATLVFPRVGLPVVLMSRSVAARDGDPVHLEVNAASERGSTQNVIAEIGPERGRVTMAGAHLDSVPAGPGVNDNGSGVATLLEVAATFGPRPPGRVRLGFWGGEEEGLIGSRYYVRSLSRAQQHEIATYLNFDMLGSPNAVPAIYSDGNARLGRLLRRVRPGDERAVLVGNRSDGSPFENAGIAVNGLYSGATERGPGGRPRDPCYHLPCDTFANVSMGSLLPMARAAARALYLLARDQAK